jgi:hypothetical protein
MFAVVKSIASAICGAALAVCAAVAVLLICAVAGVFTLACAAPLNAPRRRNNPGTNR